MVVGMTGEPSVAPLAPGVMPPETIWLCSWSSPLVTIPTTE